MAIKLENKKYNINYDDIVIKVNYESNRVKTLVLPIIKGEYKFHTDEEELTFYNPEYTSLMYDEKYIINSDKTKNLEIYFDSNNLDAVIYKQRILELFDNGFRISVPCISVQQSIFNNKLSGLNFIY